MSTVEEIVERVKSLPAELQREALHYVEYLKQRQDAVREGTDWSRACAAHLIAAYGPDDSIYDCD